MIYKGKIAPWYIIVVMIYNGFPLLFLSHLSSSNFLIFTFLFYYVLGDIIMIPIMINNKIVLKQDSFVYSFGFSHKEYKIANIKSVEHATSVLAASACSLDRILIDFGDDEMCASLRDNDGFLEELKLRNGAIGGGCAKIEKSNRKAGSKIGQIIIAFVILAIAGVVLFIGSMSITLDQKQMHIDVSLWSDNKIAYDKINRVDYREKLETGRRTNGFGNFKMNAGNFHNEEYGDYHLYAYVSCKAYVVVHTDKGIVVLNENTKEHTKQLYEDIKKKISPK